MLIQLTLLTRIVFFLAALSQTLLSPNFSNLVEGKTRGDLWSVQDFAHASIVLDQNQPEQSRAV
jgi:hypothetical protein